MQSKSLPYLYTFRRCPYAIRARLMLHLCHVDYFIREVDLKNKPEAMLRVSPKGTVPVLLFSNGDVLEESLDIMRWACTQEQAPEWAKQKASAEEEDLLLENETQFSSALHHYKYADRDPSASQEEYRNACEPFLERLEALLSQHSYLFGKQPSLTDLALFPFVRQCAKVDEEWFENSSYGHLKKWMTSFSDLASTVMVKLPPWQPEDQPLLASHIYINKEGIQ